MAAAAERFAPEPALLLDDGERTYEELFGRAGGVARAIQGSSPSRSTVAISVREAESVYVSVLACVLAGRMFCLINPDDPEPRRRSIVESLRPALWIGEPGAGAQNSVAFLNGVERLDMAGVGPEGFAPSEERSELLYVLFTSGSTGVPKGVRITERGVQKFLEWSVGFYGAGRGDRWSQFNAPTFDLSLVDLFTALLSGAALVPFHDPVDRLRPVKKLARHGVTVWHAVPSTLQLLLEGGAVSPSALASVRVYSFCGEPLMTHSVAELRAKAPEARIINTYGPTETTFFCTAHQVEGRDLESEEPTIPLGGAIPGWNLELKPAAGDSEAADAPCSNGELFEVLIHGDYIGRGYLGDVEGGFLGGSDGPNRFLTGDLVRQSAGAIYFDSRSDRQRKVRGVRLELGEVERAAFAVGLGHSCAEVVAGDLVLFLSEEEIDGEEPAEFRERLAVTLPAAMVPSVVHCVARFPRTASSKIDLDALKRSLAEEVR